MHLLAKIVELIKMHGKTTIKIIIVVFGFLSHISKRAGLVGFHCKYTAAEECKVPDIL
jgi:hypothetical protein